MFWYAIRIYAYSYSSSQSLSLVRIITYIVHTGTFIQGISWYVVVLAPSKNRKGNNSDRLIEKYGCTLAVQDLTASKSKARTEYKLV